ncbi:MAG: T9SS type A sorting domain-containing protein [Crocinitomicaceae bacterium]
MKHLLTTLLLFFLFNGYSATIYVDVNATGSNNGTSWANAYTDLQVALSIAFINDEIWVATGIYKATTSTDRSISFVMKNGVDLYGGFDGTETAISQRNISANPTTLSGDIGQLGDNTDNTRKIVRILNFTAPFTMDGFRILSGYDAASSGRGAAMYIDDNSGPLLTFRNLIIFNNYAHNYGGAVHIDESNIEFHNCEFLYNSAFSEGAAMYADNGSNSYIDMYDCQFIGNSSNSGAVFKFDGPELIMERTLITNNVATSGDLMFIDNSTTNFQLNNSLVVGNKINNNSSSVINSFASTQGASKITNSTICHNSNTTPFTPSAECIGNANAAIIITNSIIYGNYMTGTNEQIEPGNSVAHCIVENGYTTGTNVSTADPIFVSPGTLAISPFDASSYDYSLQSTSSAISYGDNAAAASFTVDYLNNTRIQQSLVDCGAIESPFSDLQAPIANCFDTVVYLSALGTASIDSSFIDNNSTDNIGIVSYTLSQTDFNCSHLGANTITLTVGDQSSNTSSCASTVTVIDNIGPNVATQNVSVYLDQQGMASITADTLDNGTSDNCGLDTISVSVTDFTCNDVGSNLLTFTATDVYGNTSSTSVTVTVIDSVPPTAIAQDLTVYLGGFGNVTISSSMIDGGSFDDCNIGNIGLSQSTFNCSQIGTNTVTLTATDDYGNSSSDVSTVTVLDTISPIVLGQNITVNLDDSDPYTIVPQDIDVGSSDNCSMSLSLSQTLFNTVGTYTVDLTAIDPSGNATAETFVVEVVDTVSNVNLTEIEVSTIEVYPNPSVSGFFNLSSSEKIEALILFDVSGREQTVEFNSETGVLNASNLSSGRYWLKLQLQTGTMMEELIISH